MSAIRAIEARIARIEGFRVKVLYETGKDVRSDRASLPSHPYARMLKNSANVRECIDTRFKTTYPGFDVHVLDHDGRRVHGLTRLSTVRDTYLAE